jgi:hypothetical protein
VTRNRCICNNPRVAGSSTSGLRTAARSSARRSSSSTNTRRRPSRRAFGPGVGCRCRAVLTSITTTLSVEYVGFRARRFVCLLHLRSHVHRAAGDGADGACHRASELLRLSKIRQEDLHEAPALNDYQDAGGLDARRPPPTSARLMTCCPSPPPPPPSPPGLHLCMHMGGGAAAGQR